MRNQRGEVVCVAVRNTLMLMTPADRPAGE